MGKTIPDLCRDKCVVDAVDCGDDEEADRYLYHAAAEGLAQGDQVPTVPSLHARVPPPVNRTQTVWNLSLLSHIVTVHSFTRFE